MEVTTDEPYLLPYDLMELPDDLKSKAMMAIGENEHSRKSCLEELKRRIKKQNKYQICMDEEFLLRFLRHSKFESDKAFARLEKFYRIQKVYPEYFEYCSPTALPKAHFNQVYLSPYRLKDNSVLYIHKFFGADPSDLTPKEKFYLDTLNTEDHLERPINQMTGATFIMDCEGINLSKMFHISPGLIKANFEVLHGSFPYRVKGIHVVNINPLFKIFYGIAYPLMPKKLQNRLYIHTDNVTWRSLHDIIPRKALPKEYGGLLEPSRLINTMVNVYEKERKLRKHSPYIYLKPSQISLKDCNVDKPAQVTRETEK